MTVLLVLLVIVLIGALAPVLGVDTSTREAVRRH